MAGYREFIRGLFQDPRGVSAPTPSSPALAAAMAAQVNPRRPGLVIELGAGTGVVTEALLKRGIAPERLLVIEYGTYFAGLLRQRFPGVRVVEGDGFAFEDYLPDGAAIAAVVCGVPLLNFSVRKRRTLIERSLALQGAGGRFIQLSYGWNPPVKSAAGIRPSGQTVWRNFPPAHVWTYVVGAQRAPAAAAELAVQH